MFPIDAAAKPVKDPQPSVDRIDDLAKRILTGDIYLPKFQREFVWEKEQVLELLDSVARNFPIGSVLLWQSKQELRSESKIADLEIALPKPEYPVNYLLDGQQRLSSICGALYWRGGDPRSPWNVAYDLRTRTFHHLDHTDEPAQHLVRLNKLPNPSSFFLQVAALDAAHLPELAANARQLFDRFKDYKVATVTLGDMALADVAPIFERINSTGTRLTIVDLMRAATWSPDFDLVDSIDSIRDALMAKSFEGVERKAILRNVSVAMGGAFTVESIDDLRKAAPADLKIAVADTEHGYRRAVDFLSTHIKVPSSSVVPYTNQIVVLAEILRRIPKPTATQWRAVEQWFWRTGVSGYFSGWNSGMMASDLAAVCDFSEGKTEDILIPTPPPSVQIWSSRHFRLNNAHSKILALVLAYEKPHDLLTGQTIDTDKALSWQNAKEFHHFFPQAFLREKGISTIKASALSNILYLSSSSNKIIGDQAPSVYLKRLLDEHGDNAMKWLATNLVGKAAIAAALQDDFDGFLSARSEAIDAHARKLAGWATA
ncbi:GmrSD restriction endonuclease domain-containing protein [Thiomonas sp.]